METIYPTYEGLLPNAVVLCGGTGGRNTADILRGECQDLTLAVTTGDTGGSTGDLRLDDEGNMVRVAYGDVRQVLMGAATNERAARNFGERRPNGHVVGNLVLMHLVEKFGIDEAIRLAGGPLGVGATVLPACLHPENTIAMEHYDDDGFLARVTGEHNIDEYPITDPNPRIYTMPDDAVANQAVLEAITHPRTGLLIIAQGSPETSVKATLALPGVPEAIKESPAPLLLLANQALPPNIPPHVASPHVADYVRSIEAYTGGRPVDGVLYTTNVEAVRGILDEKGRPLRPILCDEARLASLGTRIAVGRDLFSLEQTGPSAHDALAHLRQGLRHDRDGVLSGIREFLGRYHDRQQEAPLYV